MVLLLGSRGRGGGRSGSKFADALRGIVGTLFGQSSLRRREDGRRRSKVVPAWFALAAALGCFIGGYLTGDHLGQAKAGKPGAGDALHAQGRAPGLLPEFDAVPLTHQAFIVSGYTNVAPAVAKAKAKALSDYLVSRKLERAKPLEWSSSPPVWMVAVYYEGDAELAATKKLLEGLPQDVPDDVFVHWRKTEAEWPKAMPIR